MQTFRMDEFWQILTLIGLNLPYRSTSTLRQRRTLLRRLWLVARNCSSCNAVLRPWQRDVSYCVDGEFSKRLTERKTCGEEEVCGIQWFAMIGQGVFLRCHRALEAFQPKNWRSWDGDNREHCPCTYRRRATVPDEGID